MKSVIILSGPIGAGKTTVSKELVRISPAPLTYIEGDTFWQHIAKVDETTDFHKNFRMIMRSMVATAIPYALNGFEAIVDFSVPPGFLETALKMTNFRDVPLSYVVIRPSVEICKTRAATRSEGIIEDYSPYLKLYNLFNDSPTSPISEDTADPTEIANQIREGLDASKYRVR